MPRAPMIGTASPMSQVSQEDLLMAAAMMHDEGRLVQPDTSMYIDEKDIQRDPDVVGEPGPERLIDQQPNLERDKERDQRGIDREKRMRERQEEFEGDTFRMRRR